MSTIGTMCGIDQAIDYLRDCQPRNSKDDMPGRIINRLRYVRDKDKGVKPKYHKGLYGKKYDSWTCGNCGRVLAHGVVENYCCNCGYAVLWDSPRCLTGYKAEVTE